MKEGKNEGRPSSSSDIYPVSHGPNDPFYSHLNLDYLQEYEAINSN